MDGSDLALYAQTRKNEQSLEENADEEFEDVTSSENRQFVDALNADSDVELKADSEDDVNVNIKDLLDVSESEDELEASTGEGNIRDEAEVQRRLKEKRRKARKDRNTFQKFVMPKLSDLRRAAGVLPKEVKLKEKKKKKAFGAEDDNAETKNAGPGLIAEIKDSAKLLLAYFTGEELYEHKKLELSDIPDIISSAWYTNRRRFLINVLGWYNLNLTGFSKYYKLASKTLLAACRSKHVKPFYLADLLEEGADPNVSEVGTDSKPIHYLVRRANLKGVKFLCEAGADILAFDAQHRNALMCACDTTRTGNQVRIVRYLLSRPEHAGGKNLEHRDTGGNTAAINSIFKGNVWVLRALLLHGARVTESDPSLGYESAHDIARWVYAAGLLSDVDQLPPAALNDPKAMSCWWKYFSPKGYYYWAPVLLFQHQYKYSQELCFRMCQNAKKTEDLVQWEPKPKRAVLIMTDQKAENREQTRARRERERERKERHDKKLVSRKLDHEIKEVDQWNKQRLMFATRIDGQFKKGLRGQDDKSTHKWVMKQHVDSGPKVWEAELKTGSHYISAAPPVTPTKIKPIELAAVLEAKHNATHNPKHHINVFAGNATENAYARASWVEKDSKTRVSGIENENENDSNQNGWKLASRTEFGYIDKSSQWARNKVARPFIVPPTQDEVYLSDGSNSDEGESDDDKIIAVKKGKAPVLKV